MILELGNNLRTTREETLCIFGTHLLEMSLMKSYECHKKGRSPDLLNNGDVAQLTDPHLHLTWLQMIFDY